MNIFVVYAHPDPRSFAATLKNLALDVLMKQGHALQLSDLYGMHFKAYVSRDDFTNPLDDPIFDLQAEQRHASETGTFSQDIMLEQQKLVWADTVLFYFPMWWYSIPAILKGWVDRVFAYGFAYGDQYLLTGKRTMLTLTTGGPSRPYTPEKQRVINDMMDTFQRGTLHFCGMEILPPLAFYGADHATTAQRDQWMLQYRQVLHSLDLISPMRLNGLRLE